MMLIRETVGDKLVPVLLCAVVPHGVVKDWTAACEVALSDYTLSRPKHVCVCVCVCARVRVWSMKLFKVVKKQSSG